MVAVFSLHGCGSLTIITKQNVSTHSNGLIANRSFLITYYNIFCRCRGLEKENKCSMHCRKIKQKSEGKMNDYVNQVGFTFRS